MNLFSKKFQKRIVIRDFARTKKFKAFMILSACSGFLLLSLGAFHIYKDTQQTIEKERAGLADQNEISFEKTPHQPHLYQFLSFLRNTAHVRGTHFKGLEFDESIFNGLLSNRVAGIKRIGTQWFIGTDLRVIKTSLANLTDSTVKSSHQSAELPTVSLLVEEKNRSLAVVYEQFWFVGTGGIFWQTSAENSTRFLFSQFGDFADQTMPASNIVTALTVDKNSGLRAGIFRRGIFPLGSKNC